MFVNGTKIPLIPPLLTGLQVVTGFLGKANLFDKIFSRQCTTIVNNSSTRTNLTFKTL